MDAADLYYLRRRTDHEVAREHARSWRAAGYDVYVPPPWAEVERRLAPLAPASPTAAPPAARDEGPALATLLAEFGDDLARLTRLASRLDTADDAPAPRAPRLAPLVRKAVPFTLKTVSATGAFEGFASVYGVVDWQGDVVMRGAFTRSLRDRPRVPVLWQHDATKPIGTAALEDRPDGLVAHGQLVTEDPQGASAAAHLKAGTLGGLSIGFRAVDEDTATVDGRRVRRLLDVDLWEVSLVTFPANPEAQILDVRGEEADAFAATVAARVARIDAALDRLAARAGGAT